MVDLYLYAYIEVFVQMNYANGEYVFIKLSEQLKYSRLYFDSIVIILLI